MMDYTGKELGHYRIVKRLGHGGFADVYLGEHVYLNTQAAIKLLRTQLTEGDAEQFRAEAAMIAHLVHPHIIRVLDFGIDQGSPFLVMEYAPNGNLRQRIPKGTRAAPSEFMPYVKQVASALHYAHEQRIIHRDVKPENMLLGQDNQVRLSDFGIALITQSSQSQETESTVRGTISYMAPEQILGKARPASDQYALAIVVYEWLSGMKPFRGSYVEIVTQQLSAPPPPLEEQSLSLPLAVRHVLFRALDKDPHQRFPDVQDFANALEHALQTGAAGSTRAIFSGATEQQGRISRGTKFTTATTEQQSPPSRAAHQQYFPDTQQRIVEHVPGETSAPPRLRPTREQRRGVGSVLRAFATAVIVIPLLLCALSIGGYAYLTMRHPASEGTALARDFTKSLSTQNYDEAYTDLGPSLTSGTSHDGFIQQAQSEDRCYGPITSERELSASSTNGNQVYTYTMMRSKLPQPYHLHVTVGKDFFGNWHVTDYNSDAGLNQPSCH